MTERLVDTTGKTGSIAEDRFIDIFCEVFGPKNTKYISPQYPFVDIYGGNRFIDFVLETEDEKIAIEIDGETYHNPKSVSENKYTDDLLKQNSLVYQGWKLYRWTYNELTKSREKVKDELRIFLEDFSEFKLNIDYLPEQKGKVIELRSYQRDALDSLKDMRAKNESIGLLYHATGTGKTVTAISDAKIFGKRTLFIAHRKEIIYQAKETFEKLWSEKEVGLWLGENKENKYNICGSIQSISNDLKKFKRDDFDYIIIDEAHHGAADSYKKLLNYFKPKFTLGLTATPDRMDGEDLLSVFKKVSHKLDLEKAVEIDALVPVRCIRVKTNIDISDVRINGIRYNTRDLESKLFLEERNKIIVDTYFDIVKDKKTVIFCASVDHSEEIAKQLREREVRAKSISARLDNNSRKDILDEYENKNLNVLCACDLLNEGWDSPNTEVLFMARPTMSKTLYMQQLGRGMRKSIGKEYLMVFDFIDNANLFNMPYSTHRVFDIDKYKPGEIVLASKSYLAMEKNLIYKGEKPDIYLDYPVSVLDYEAIDLFDWQKEVKDMLSEMEFVRMVDVQSGTISKYIKEGKLIPDLILPTGHRAFNYFKEDSITKYAKQYGWEIITPANIKDKFMEYVKIMDMSYSYKPVFLLGFLEYMNKEGNVLIEDLVEYFIGYYEDRRSRGLLVEKKKCLYLREYTRAEVKRNILSNPFGKFQDMNFMDYKKDIEYIKLNKNILKKLDKRDIDFIIDHCNNKLDEYYS